MKGIDAPHFGGMDSPAGAAHVILSPSKARPHAVASKEHDYGY